MENFRELLTDVWREVCRHMEIQASACSIADMLRRLMPLDMLLVRRYDAGRQVLDTVAMARRKTTGLHVTVQGVLTPQERARLSAWAATKRVLGSGATEFEDAALLVPPEISGGALVLVASHGEHFASKHEEMAAALLEPFSAALENDRRLHELATLREAAEAERRSLLTRIGRREIREEIVGADTGLKHVMQRVQLVAQSDVPVLILGDTGTGKEVVSRAIHARSPRSEGPFIRVNCGAIPSELIDSQLFGHEKGSFTGAAETRKGWFERAHGGTLFLDEIGELPRAAQVRFLRVLQDGFVERVGGERPIRVDVRIIAATHRELAEMVKQGTFREDLWYRVNVFPILLPRLCERIEDIPSLTRHFARRAAHHFGLPYVEPSAEDLLALTQYSWPGNIRELGAVIDRAAILGNGASLQVVQALGVDRPPAGPVFPGPSLPTHPARAADTPPSAPPRPVRSLDAAMKEHIERTLLVTRGRIEGHGGAADLLEINPHTLRARMRKLQIDWSRFRG